MLAVTVYMPGNAFATAVTEACPVLSVVAVVEVIVAVGPLVGALKVTVTPGTGLLYKSVANTVSGLGNAVCMGVDCKYPEFA